MLTNDHYKIYKGKYFHKKKRRLNSRVIAFDLDETLGSFADLETLWSALQEYTDSNNPVEFNRLLDLYPEFLRYGIIPILEYLMEKKRTGECSNIFIYTNNQCEVGWVELISKYFDYTLKSKCVVFNQIIHAFKINNRRVEMSRTTHSKTHSDFIKCTLLPKSTEIFFLDNSQYPEMKQERVYYIQPKSYIHHLSTQEIIKRFISSTLILTLPNTNKDILKNYLLNYFIERDIYNGGNPRIKDLEIDILVAQKLMYHLRDFFYIANANARTKKARQRFGHLTRKAYVR